MINKLTQRERDVLELMAEGLSNKLIADKLGVSAHTAKFHVVNLCKKLGASTRTHAAVMWIAEKAFAEGFEAAKRTSECPTCRAQRNHAHLEAA